MTTKPNPQKMSTMLTSFFARLRSQTQNISAIAAARFVPNTAHAGVMSRSLHVPIRVLKKLCALRKMVVSGRFDKRRYYTIRQRLMQLTGADSTGHKRSDRRVVQQWRRGFLHVLFE